jgi:anti-sigma B factor antagonist
VKAQRLQERPEATLEDDAAVNDLMTNVELRCEVEPDRDSVTVRPVGEIDLATVGPIEARLDELWASGFRKIVLDLRRVSFMDSAGLRLVIGHNRRAEQDGAALRVEVAEGGAVHRLLQMTATLGLLSVTLVPARR